jgi:hypothetical protein
MQQALQWWSCRQSMKLFLEAEKIRDGLLQESFTIRRSLELVSGNHVELSGQKTQECLEKIDNFHQSLVKLSDRLFPVYLQHSLPLAIESLLEPWLASHPHLYFHIDMPTEWPYEPAERSMIILRTLEELLKVTLPEVLTPVSIDIKLKNQENRGVLTIKITYPDVPTFIFYSTLPESGYICDSFRFLTSGKSICSSKNLSASWYFCW